MTRAIAFLSVVPIRAEPTHKSEQTSQLLFGESCTILTKKKEWAGSYTHLDVYKRQFDRLSEPSFISPPKPNARECFTFLPNPLE